MVYFSVASNEIQWLEQFATLVFTFLDKGSKYVKRSAQVPQEY